MCRLFGFRASSPTSVEEALFTHCNSLGAQSREHQDGWGIVAWHGEGPPEAAHSLSPAHGDPEFERLARGICSRTLVAHVRKASIGAVEHRNAHPFRHGPWAFAHNGTIERFAACRARLEEHISATLRGLIRGETDSERCFYLVLTELERLGGTRPSARLLAQALARTMARVAELADAGRSGTPSSLNFMITDGELLVASRRGRSLHVAELTSEGPTERQVIIASEVLLPVPFRAVPEDSVVAVDRDLSVRQWALGELLD